MLHAPAATLTHHTALSPTTVTSTSWFPLGPIFIAAGVAHFTEEQGFKNMMPHQVRGQHTQLDGALASGPVGGAGACWPRRMRAS